MNSTFLTLKISRRAIGAVQLADEALTLTDARHLSSKSDVAVVAARNFVHRLAATTKPACLVLDAPAIVPGRSTSRVVEALKTLATELGIPVFAVAGSEVLTAYGLRGLRTREELRNLARAFWPELRRITSKAEPCVADAAAAALYAECRMSLERIPAG